MIIKNFFEFELKGPGPLGRACTSTTGYFDDKTKITKENLGVDHYLLLKYCMMQCTLIFPTWPNHIQNLTPKCKILSVFLT